MFSVSSEELGNLEWKPFIEELRSIGKESESAVIVSFIAQRDLLEGVLNVSETFGKQMFLIAENAEDFMDPYDPPYIVIPKQKISSIDPDRNLHAKIFLFGKKLSSELQVLRCLLGSPNATITGCCRNVEFWATSEAIMDFSGSPEKSLLGLFKNEKIDPSFVPLTEVIREKGNDVVVAPLVDLIWRLIRNSRGLYAGLDPGKSECLSDKLITSEKHVQAILVHTLGDNSLWKSVRHIIQSTIGSAEKECLLEIVSPYHNWRGISNTLKICRKSLKRYDQKIRIRLLTTFPPHFPNMYLEKQAFGNLEKVELKDKRIEFEYRMWTKLSEIEIPKLLNDQSLQNLSRVFLHGKVLIASNDKSKCQALLGSPNLTGAAITPSPKVNLECAVWERNPLRANSLKKTVGVLWKSAKVLSPKLKEQLIEWQKELSEDGTYFNVWNECVEVLRQCVHVELVNDSSGNQMLFYDKISEASIDVEFSEECPSIEAHKIKCVFLPDLDVRKRREVEAGRSSNNHLRFGLNKLRIEPCRLFYKIEIPTRFVRETKAKFKKCGKNKISIEAPAFRMELYDIKILARTVKGVREYDIVKKEDDLIYASIPSRILGKTVKIRLYSKDDQSNISLGWRSVAVVKRRPEIYVEKSCICNSAFCIMLEERLDPYASSLIPQSITLRLEEDDVVAPKVHIQNKISVKPYQSNHFFLFFDEFPFSQQRELPIKVYFRDEHSHLRKKEDLYDHFSVKPILGKRDCSLYEAIKKIIDSSKHVRINTLPKENCMVDKAPISILLKFPDEVMELLSEYAHCLYIEWHLLHWGRIWHGDPISTGINSSLVKLNIQPYQFGNALQIDPASMNFEGMFEAQVFVELIEGWRVPIRQMRFKIQTAGDYIEKIFSGMSMSEVIEKYVHNTSDMSKMLIDIIYDCISKDDRFRSLDRQRFLDSFEWGFFCFPGTFGDNSTDYQGFLLTSKKGDSLLNRITEEIAAAVAPSFLADPSQPNVDGTFFSRQLRQRLKTTLLGACKQNANGLIIFPNLIFSELGLSYDNSL